MTKPLQGSILDHDDCSFSQTEFRSSAAVARTRMSSPWAMDRIVLAPSGIAPERLAKLREAFTALLSEDYKKLIDEISG